MVAPAHWLDRRYLQWQGGLALAAALLLVVTGILLDQSVLHVPGHPDVDASLLTEAVQSLLSVLPGAWGAGLAALAAACCLWTAFHLAAAGRRPAAFAGPAGGAITAGPTPTGMTAEPARHQDRLPAFPRLPPEQLDAWSEQARLLADSLAASVANAEKALAAGGQAGAAAHQGAAMLARMQAALVEAVEQMQQATGRMARLTAQSQQVESLLAAFRERGEQVRLHLASPGTAGRTGGAFVDAYRKDLKQLAILVKTMDMDARDSHGLLDKTLQEVHAAVQLSQQGGQAVSEMGRAASALTEEVGILHQVAQVHAEAGGQQAEEGAALAQLARQAIAGRQG